MLRCVYTLRSAARVAAPWRASNGLASTVAYFSQSTRLNRESLGLTPLNRNKLCFTGPQSASDLKVLRHSSIENSRLTSLIKSAARRRDWESAMVAFRQASPPDAVLYSVLLHAADRCNQAEEAFTLYDEMCRKEIPMTGAHFVPLIRLAGRTGQFAKALSFKEDLCTLGIECDAFICVALVQAHKQAGDVPGAVQTWQDMKEIGVRMSPPLLSVLMSTVAQTGDVARTEALLEEAVDFVPNHIHLNCLLDACKHACDAISAFRILKEYQAKGIQPDVVTFTLMLGVLRHAQRGKEEVEHVFKQMKDCGVVPDKFFIEEHLCCALDMDIRVFLGDITLRETCSLEALQAADQLLKQARSDELQQTRMTAEVEQRVSEMLNAKQQPETGATPPTEWIRVLCTPQVSSTGSMSSEYFWDRASGRTQWEVPSGPILQTVQAASTS